MTTADMQSGIIFLYHISPDFENLYNEASDLLENGKVEGILEEMFAAIEFIKCKSGSGLLIAQVFEKKHGYGVAINTDEFSWEVSDCLQKVIEFVSAEIVSNVSRILKSQKVSGIYLILISTNHLDRPS